MNLYPQFEQTIRTSTEVFFSHSRMFWGLIVFCFMAPLLPLATSGAEPKLSGVGAAMQAAVDSKDIAGAVTVVVTKDKVLHLEATGLADLARKEPMRPDSVLWIASGPFVEPPESTAIEAESHE